MTTEQVRNKGLHDLHVWWAMEHLIVLHKCIKKLRRANINWTEPRSALFEARNKLLRDDPAYQEAAWRLLCGEAVLYDGEGGESPMGTFDPYKEDTHAARERVYAERAEAKRLAKQERVAGITPPGNPGPWSAQGPLPEAPPLTSDDAEAGMKEHRVSDDIDPRLK